jgi:ketosteroid isomerase-like protein
MSVKLARTFIQAVPARNLDAAEALLDPDIETETPRGALHGIAACPQVLTKATGDEQFAVEQTETEFEEIEGEIVARTHEIARWRETGEIAYERDFAVRLTFGDEKIVRIVVMPGGERVQNLSKTSRMGSITMSNQADRPRKVPAQSHFPTVAANRLQPLGQSGGLWVPPRKSVAAPKRMRATSSTER